jgi:hypothetical protein
MISISINDASVLMVVMVDVFVAAVASIAATVS